MTIFTSKFVKAAVFDAVADIAGIAFVDPYGGKCMQ